MTELLSPARLLDIMEGNRRLTVRVIEAFPEHDLFHHTPAPGLRPFAGMVKEVITIEAAYVQGAATGEWVYRDAYKDVSTKEGLLAACEEVRQETRSLWPQVTAERLRTVESDGFFDPTPISNLDRLVYALENEIHHRGQGYIYLRLLGIEPPLFYER